MSRFRSALTIAFGMLTIAIAAACGGGVNTMPLPTSGTATVGSSPGGAGATHPSGYGVAMTFPATTDGGAGSVSLGVTPTLPAGFAAPASTARSALSIGVALTSLVFVTVTAQNTVGFGATPAFSFTLPSNVSLASGSSAYIAFFDPAQRTKGWITILGPGSINGQTVTFLSTNENLRFIGGTTYAFVLFTTTQPAPVSTAQPAGLTASPSSIAFTKIGPANGQTATLTENSGTGAPNITTFTFVPNSCASNYNYQTANGPPATIKLAQIGPTAAGCSTFTFNLFDNTSQTTLVIPVTAAPPPALSVSPASVALAGVGSFYAMTVVATEAGGAVPVITPAITGGASCTAFTFTTPGVADGAQSFSIFALLPYLGSGCSLSLSDATSGQTKTVGITLQTAGPVSVGGN